VLLAHASGSGPDTCVHDASYSNWLESHARLIESIRGAVSRQRLFIAIDHEGGRVCHTPPPITRYSYAARWAKSAPQVGASMGAELASLGINLNFAPVLDIDSNPANPVIGQRAFGKTPAAVIAAGLPFITAMEGQGVRACVKHFPGHGDTKADSHSELPHLDLSLQELEMRELQPFRAAIRSGVGMIMTSHLLFTSIDAENPVTLSRKITHDLLRVSYGFDGIVVSDDVGMRAMSGLLDAPGSMARFMFTGHDMMMICAHWTDTERARSFAHALIAARDEGLIDAEVLSASRDRIRSMLDTTAQNNVHALDESTFAKHREAGELFRDETVEVV
jgi:beta-N-acetylhexosaminidase